ncbi:unnamed protein product [Sphagnum troendelagicum]|uniref:Histone deacetylase interacting domain-containing protein n=1 Tax=Sphagnum troendelagicum TaxID=128251 RepID=A0ABP0UHN7_9BRYO
MKRSREENKGGPQVKRAAAAAGGGGGGGGGGGPSGEMSSEAAVAHQRLTTEDALSYLKAVKDKFNEDKGKYEEFLATMKDFKAQRIDTAGVIERVKELFKGHRALILGFNTFLPEGYEITLPEEETTATATATTSEQQKKQPVEFDQAINYVNKIKARFQSDEHVYKAFLEILNMYRKGNKSISEVYQEVATLFYNHPDLLEEFTCFLPESTGGSGVVSNVNSHHHQQHHHPLARSSTQQQQQHHPKREDKSSSAPVRTTPMVSKIIPKKEKPGSVQGGDHGGGSNRDRHGGAIVKIERERKKGEKERDKKDEPERKVRGGGGVDHHHRKEANSHGGGEKDMDLDAMQRLPTKRQSARRADELIRIQSKAGEAGEAYASGGAGPSLEDLGYNASSLPAFVEKVKSRLRNRETYQEFLKCLNIFNQEIISRTELQRVVGDILGKHADLMEGFNEFLTHCENEGNLAGYFSSRNLGGEFADEQKPKIEKDRERDSEKDKERDRDKEKERDGDRHRDKDKERDVKPSKEALHKVSGIPNKDKFMNKPISELDLSNCDQCTPSYRLLPKHYPRPISSHRNSLADSVLNDSWVSVTSGSEDYSFKHMRKNQYEESLFRCEDDRYELDMLLETTLSTANLVGESVEKPLDGVKQESPHHLLDQLSAIHLRSIERVYGDHGADIIELLRRNPIPTAPVIYNRLRQKQEEWSNCRVEMNKVWSEVYTKNSYKALDHRSFYFRQQDKRSLSTKGLLAEIKELNEKKRSEDDYLLATAAGSHRPLLPDLRLEYPDPAIYQDLYQIIKYACEEACTTTEQAEKILRIWTTFLEPMLGIPPRLHGMDDMEPYLKAEEALEPKGSGSSSRVSSAGANAEGCDTDVLATNAGVMEEVATARSNLVADGESAGAVQTADTNREGSILTDGAHRKEKPESASLEIEGSPGVEKLQISRVTNPSFGLKLPLENVMYNGKMSEGFAPAEREEGELSPSPELEDRNKATTLAGELRSYHVGQASEENGIEGFGHDHKDVDGTRGLEAGEHDVDEDDEGEEHSGHKSSGNSDDASEAGEEAFESGSGEDLSEHEDDDDDEGKAESEGHHAEDMADADDGEGDGHSSLASPGDRSFSNCRPLAEHVTTTADVLSSAATACNRPSQERVFYGHDLFYVLFRLHQTLYERILSAKTHATTSEQKWRLTKDTAPPNFYLRFMLILFSLLDGSVDNAKFEDECRAIIGTQSYVLFTLDKLIFKLVKQLQVVASDDVAAKLLSLYAYERAAEHADDIYHANVCVLLHDESIYRIVSMSKPAELLIQLMDRGAEKLEVPANSLEWSFQNYLDDFLLSVPPVKSKHAVFLIRNKKKFAHQEDSDEAADWTVMENASVVNGLEYKISCKTYKVSYVLDTEDLFVRRVKRRSESDLALYERNRNQRRCIFGQWIDKSVTSVDDR